MPLINEMHPSSSEKMERVGTFNSNLNKAKITKTIGFVFFNSNVILEPSNPQESKGRVIICDNQEPSIPRAEGMSRERVNFDDFESLYKLGATYGV